MIMSAQDARGPKEHEIVALPFIRRRGFTHEGTSRGVRRRHGRVAAAPEHAPL